MTRVPHAAVGGTLALALAALGGCSAEPPAATEVRAGSVLSPADLVRPPDDDVVLTLWWDSEEPVRLSMEQLESMRTVSAEIEEPFLEDTLTYEGVELADLLEVTGMPDDVEVLHTVALNEYAVDIPVSVADHAGAILATREEGVAIPVEAGGPIRLVLTPDHPEVRDESLWIWSLASVTVDGVAVPAP